MSKQQHHHHETAIERVLHLPELLETILLHLSQKDLLLSQRVSRAFRTTILTSPRLQQSLFLLPSWKLECRPFTPYARHNHPGRKPENNRLLLKAFPGCYPTVTLVIVNSDNNSPSTLATDHWSWDVCISFPADAPPDTKPAVLYPEASWRRMYLSQPPCTSLHLVRRWQRSLQPAIVREGGIRMGEFVDAATAAEGGWTWRRSFVASDRDWHFEGSIRCSGLVDEEDGEVLKSQAQAERFATRLREYLFSRTAASSSSSSSSELVERDLSEELERAHL